MYKNQKREYTSPEMEIMNARVERGFELSAITDETITNPTGNDRYAMGEGIGYRFN